MNSKGYVLEKEAEIKKMLEAIEEAKAEQRRLEAYDFLEDFVEEILEGLRAEAEENVFYTFWRNEDDNEWRSSFSWNFDISVSYVDIDNEIDFEVTEDLLKSLASTKDVEWCWYEEDILRAKEDENEKRDLRIHIKIILERMLKELHEKMK